MPLKEGATYFAPDGRRFKAELATRQYGSEPSWVLLPEDTDSRDQWRDRLSRMLFLEGGRIVQFDFDSERLIKDTGWTEADLRELAG
jgi:hypothetical protein